MAKPKPPVNPPINPDAHLLLVHPASMATAAAERWASPMFPGADMGGLIKETARMAAKVKSGDLSDIEGMLVGQAMALQTMFAHLSRSAATQEYLMNLQAMTGLALKAQAACRQTLEALVELKNPRPVVYGQANIAHQQVVNNRPVSLAQAESPALESELLNTEVQVPKVGG